MSNKTNDLGISAEDITKIAAAVAMVMKNDTTASNINYKKGVAPTNGRSIKKHITKNTCEETVPGKLIFNQYIAKQLLVKYGHPIINIKKSRTLENGTVFVFEKTEQLLKDLEIVVKETKDARVASDAVECDVKSLHSSMESSEDEGLLIRESIAEAAE